MNHPLIDGNKKVDQTAWLGKPYQTREADLGRCLVTSLDDISPIIDP
jgi:hypothetical protein